MTYDTIITMSDKERAAYWNRIDRERREAALDRAIFATPLKTLGDVRLYAKARLKREQDEFEARERWLLEALAALPQRLWGEPIAAS